MHEWFGLPARHQCNRRQNQLDIRNVKEFSSRLENVLLNPLALGRQV